jgi:prepilin-type N-terminal cleavage/methylation domain-containing protein
MNTQRSHNGARSFTLIEIMITLVITGVLATIAIPAYQNFIEDGRALMCADNLEALKPALEVFIVEHGVVPGSSAQLPSASVQKALARARATAGWHAKLVALIDEQTARGYAFAGLIEDLAKGNLSMLICPSDPNRNKAGVVSYGINNRLVGMSKDDFDKLEPGTELMGDSTADTFTDLTQDTKGQRHKHIGGMFLLGMLSPCQYANAITKDGCVTKIGKGTEDLKKKEQYIRSSTKSISERRRQIDHLWRNWK